MSDLTKTLLSMPQVLRVGVENLEYDIRYNSKTRQIEVSYEFTCGIPHISGTTTVDYEITDEKRAARLTRKALKIFSARLGDAIERALRQLASQALFEAGVDLTDSGTEMAEALSGDFRREVAGELEVRRGPRKGKRRIDRASVAQFKKQVGAIVTELKHAKSKPTKAAIARRLYDRHVNPIQEFNRKLVRYELDFNELLAKR